MSHTLIDLTVNTLGILPPCGQSLGVFPQVGLTLVMEFPSGTPEGDKQSSKRKIAEEMLAKQLTEALHQASEALPKQYRK